MQPSTLRALCFLASTAILFQSDSYSQDKKREMIPSNLPDLLVKMESPEFLGDIDKLIADSTEAFCVQDANRKQKELDTARAELQALMQDSGLVEGPTGINGARDLAEQINSDIVVLSYLAKHTRKNTFPTPTLKSPLDNAPRLRCAEEPYMRALQARIRKIAKRSFGSDQIQLDFKESADWFSIGIQSKSQTSDANLRVIVPKNKKIGPGYTFKSNGAGFTITQFRPINPEGTAEMRLSGALPEELPTQLITIHDLNKKVLRLENELEKCISHPVYRSAFVNRAAANTDFHKRAHETGNTIRGLECRTESGCPSILIGK